jgi:hypothetical protein
MTAGLFSAMVDSIQDVNMYEAVGMYTEGSSACGFQKEEGVVVL